ncbi:multidrug efflux system membrane fusion protein [Hasllibacter halocynthiae]|uniref:Multidrug efflux system membrane fusion protein n=1 Tax=Hasllibacter halocynthiae TaxID=595589 RepID=A0A2T0X8Z8_9RHOB|nr:efflux RND transporter periplasmic adaptor subunit [Hasllibacter halocynthiae]PRY95418.1 multidrug efflux system membrane fusion protein [Hasllibacter halocynthiae]
MRLISVLLALAVSVTLYALVFERDRLVMLASRGDAAEAEIPVAAVADPEAGAPPEAGTARLAVVAARIEAEPVRDAVLLRGQTEASRQVEARAETSGLVVSEPLRRGAEVRAGEALCALDPGTRQDDLEEARARLAEARARLPEAEARVPAAQARQAEAAGQVLAAEAGLIEARARLREAEINANAAERLSEGGFAADTRVANAEASLESARAGVIAAQAQQEGAAAGVTAAAADVDGAEAAVQSARAGIQAAQASVAAAERELERLVIETPFDGLLETDTAELGALLQPGAVCATVLQLDPIKLVAFLPETELNAARVGARAGGRLATGERVEGEVAFVARSADPATRTFRVEVEIPNEDGHIRDGQTVELVIEGDARAGHLIPRSAMTLDDDGALGVRLNVDGITRFAPVEILRDERDGVWVTGLPDTAEVIVTGQEYVRDGVPIDVTFRQGAIR